MVPSNTRQLHCCSRCNGLPLAKSFTRREVIIINYMDEVISCPTTADVVDGKHIRITVPPHSRSYYYNYKGYHSIVLLGVVDYNYKLINISVGANGATCDAQVFFYSNLYQALARNEMSLPPRESIPSEEMPILYFLLGDDGFSLREWLMKPFPH